jgi:hypothetical protein
MTFRTQAEQTAQAIVDTLGAAPSAAQSKQIADLIERAIIDSYQDAAGRCANVAREFFSADKDLAHKVADEIRRANIALIANLSSMR